MTAYLISALVQSRTDSTRMGHRAALHFSDNRYEVIGMYCELWREGDKFDVISYDIKEVKNLYRREE